MGVNHRGRKFAVSVLKCTFAVLLLSLTATCIISNSGEVAAQPPCKPRKPFVRPILRGCPGDECNVCETLGATWYRLRSPDEEKRAVAALFNRYCIRCHGVDGRGVWDIPDVPNFTNARWQACRSNDQLARIILEGRGAVMPPFRERCRSKKPVLSAVTCARSCQARKSRVRISTVRRARRFHHRQLSRHGGTVRH